MLHFKFFSKLTQTKTVSQRLLTRREYEMKKKILKIYNKKKKIKLDYSMPTIKKSI